MLKAAGTEAAVDGRQLVTADPEIVAVRRGIFECVLAERDHDRIYGRMVKAGDTPSGLIEGHPRDTEQFGFDCVRCADRPALPLIRTDGASVSATWDKAPDRVAGAPGRFPFDHGPAAAMVFVSARCTRKDSQLLQKSMHAAIDTKYGQPLCPALARLRGCRSGGHTGRQGHDPLNPGDPAIGGVLRLRFPHHGDIPCHRSQDRDSGHSRPLEARSCRPSPDRTGSRFRCCPRPGRRVRARF